MILGYEATVIDAFRDVEDALIAISTLREEYEARSRQLDWRKRLGACPRARYDGGVTS